VLGRISSSFLKLAVSFFAVASFSTVFAANIALSTCSSGTLSSYDPNGCAIGILDYYDFSYFVANGNTGPGAANIAVTPTSTGFSFGPVTNTSGVTEQFEIYYYILIDPSPVITGGSLHLDVNGTITVSEIFCNDQTIGAPGSPTCIGQSNPPSIMVEDVANLMDASITFQNPATTSQWVGLFFNLAPGASFDGLDADSNVLTLVPEPSSVCLAFIGILGLAGGYKLRKRHAS
jgi:hypothetical protein